MDVISEGKKKDASQGWRTFEDDERVRLERTLFWSRNCQIREWTTVSLWSSIAGIMPKHGLDRCSKKKLALCSCIPRHPQHQLGPQTMEVHNLELRLRVWRERQLGRCPFLESLFRALPPVVLISDSTPKERGLLGATESARDSAPPDNDREGSVDVKVT